jgi:hypothetical protein
VISLFLLSKVRCCRYKPEHSAAYDISCVQIPESEDVLTKAVDPSLLLLMRATFPFNFIGEASIFSS